MGSDGKPPDADGDPPKKKGLNLSLFLGPTTDVQTSKGQIYLYRPRVSDYTSFEKLSASEPTGRFREFLPHVASLSARSKLEKEREPLAQELVAQLSNEEVEALAEAYASSTALQTARVGSKEKSGLPREEGESATSYVDRLLKKQLADHVEDMRRMREQMFASTSSIFDQVRKSSSALGSTLSEFDRLTRDKVSFTLPEQRMDHFNAINEHHARLARERAEELEMVRLTGKMTAESAQTLKDLAEAATVLLERLDERDQKADQSTRKQIKIAVWSVGISAVIAVLALVVAGFAYFQDLNNGRSGDKFQAELLAAVKEGNRQQSALQQENQRLRMQVEVLEAKIARVAEAQSAKPPSNNVASAARRATSPGSTVPPP